MRLDKGDVKVVLVILGCAAVIAFGTTVFGSDNKNPPQVMPNQSPSQVELPPSPSRAKNIYTEKQKAEAQILMNAVKANHKVYEEGPHLVVEMRQYVEDKNTLLTFVTRVADADCILNGGPRNIYFYDPSMHQVAQADTLNGIRLKD